MLILKKLFFQPPPAPYTVVNFIGAANMKNKPILIKAILFIENDKALLNDIQHQNKLIYTLIQE